MRLSELQTKEIVNIDDGKRIGMIIDVVVDPLSGRINYFVLQEGKGSKKFFASRDEYDIRWEQIIKIGEDIILVDSKKGLL